MARVQKGDDLKIRANDWNNIVDASDFVKDSFLNQKQPPRKSTLSPVIIPVWSPISVNIGAIFSNLEPTRLVEDEEDPEASKKAAEYFYGSQLELRARSKYPNPTPPPEESGNVPTPEKNWAPTPMFAVSLDSCTGSGVVRCAVAGLATTYVNVTEDTKYYRGVAPNSSDAISDALNLAPVGSGYLVWREEGLGKKQAVVQIGSNQPPIVYPVGMVCTNQEDIDEALESGEFPPEGLPTPIYDIHIGVAMDGDLNVNSQVLEDVDVTASPHFWRRPAGLVSIEAATTGFGVYDTWDKTFYLLWCNEVVHSGTPQGGEEFQVLMRDEDKNVTWGWLRWH